MSAEPNPQEAARFAPRATREMAGMFDDVSGRYEFLNRLMSLGRDRAWRAAMWSAVPEPARAVLDLCTGNGDSLTGLRRPGRLVLGMDVSLRMLAIAADRQDRAGWAPRLVCADAFHLPLGDASLDAMTIAFGVRNLRPRPEALAEIRRVLKPEGTLAVLEAAAPAPGPLSVFHDFYLRHVVPLAGRLSHDPSAYLYLSRSIFEFGGGPEFERDLVAAGFNLEQRRSFMLGAARLWVARRSGGDGQNASDAPATLQNARREGAPRGGPSSNPSAAGTEWRAWTRAQLIVSAALTLALVYGLWVLLNSGGDLPLEGWQRRWAWVLLIGGAVAFAARSVVLLARLFGPPPRR